MTPRVPAPSRHSPLFTTKLSAFIAVLLSAAQVSAIDPATPHHTERVGPAGGKQAAAIQMLVPGFAVRALPLALPNINTVRYRADGKLVALCFNGQVYVLSDTDGDGLEDHAALFYDPGRQHLSLYLAVTPPGFAHGQGVFIARKGNLALELDTDGDDRADKEIIVASNWENPKRFPGGASDVIGVAIDPHGLVYFGLGATNSQNGYLLDQGVSAYRLESERGTILKLSPDLSKREIVATGIRASFGVTFNAAGDLFATDQEGATWMPNGNPFDELLHIQPGRHYGFPPRHPIHLPAVIDEPSVMDYGPQHQSTCGVFFNEPVLPGGRAFGPAWWRGDAFVAGESRGKLYRTKLVKTPAGYVGQDQIIAALSWLTIDQCVSPAGDLVVTAHSGPPDWGTGPTGIGRLFKISHVDANTPQPVLAYAASPTEVHVTFDQPLPESALAELARRMTLTAGLYVREGDAFETFRPGYRATKAQQEQPRVLVAVEAVRASEDRRSFIITTAEQRAATPRSLDIAEWPRARPTPDAELAQASVLSLGISASGVTATWRSDEGDASWSGWLPHYDLQVARELTAASAGHQRLWQLASQPGTLTLRGQLDLWSMLRPAVQPGERVDFVLPAEKVSLSFLSATDAPRLAFPGLASPPTTNTAGTAAQVLRHSPRERRWLPLEVTVRTGPAGPALAVSWTTAEDDRPRALPLRRVLVPWASPAEPPAPPPPPPELLGGNRARGQQLFALCSMCHGLNSEGSRVGPDLSNLVSRDYASVVKDIVDPNATINPDHVAYTFELTNGEILVAVVLEENSDHVLLANPGGAPSRLSKREIVSMKSSPVSLMPAGLDQALGAGGMKDLLTFLMLPSPR